MPNNHMPTNEPGKFDPEKFAFGLTDIRTNAQAILGGSAMLREEIQKLCRQMETDGKPLDQETQARFHKWVDWVEKSANRISDTVRRIYEKAKD